MKLVKRDEVNEYKNSDKCLALEYPLGDKDLNIAVIKLTGRYPEQGMVVNDVCKEVVYVEEGDCRLVFSDKEVEEVELKAGDIVLLEPGEKYYWEGNATLVVPCTPAWYPEQHREVG